MKNPRNAVPATRKPDPRLPDVFRNHHSEDIMIRVTVQWKRGEEPCPDCGHRHELMLGELGGRPYLWACYACGGAAESA
jgi:hypothetical protein